MLGDKTTFGNVLFEFENQFPNYRFHIHNSRHIRSKIPLKEDLLKPSAVSDLVYKNMLENQ